MREKNRKHTHTHADISKLRECCKTIHRIIKHFIHIIDENDIDSAVQFHSCCFTYSQK